MSDEDGEAAAASSHLHLHHLQDVEKLRRRLQLLETKEEVRTPLSALQLEDTPRYQNDLLLMQHFQITEEEDSPDQVRKDPTSFSLY